MGSGCGERQCSKCPQTDGGWDTCLVHGFNPQPWSGGGAATPKAKKHTLENPSMACRRAKAYEAMGQPKQALADLQKANKLDAATPDTRVGGVHGYLQTCLQKASTLDLPAPETRAGLLALHCMGGLGHCLICILGREPTRWTCLPPRPGWVGELGWGRSLTEFPTKLGTPGTRGWVFGFAMSGWVAGLGEGGTCRTPTCWARPLQCCAGG